MQRTHTGMVMRGGLLALVLCLGLAACGESKPSRFYILKAERPADLALDSITIGQGVSVLIDAVSIPDYLDKPQIVTTGTGNEIVLGEFDRWGEPLEENIARVIGENLSVALETDRVFQADDRRSVDPQFVLQVDILRFDLNIDGEALLMARWALMDGARENELMVARSTLATPLADQAYATMLAAMNSNLGKLTAEIAAAVMSMDRS